MRRVGWIARLTWIVLAIARHALQELSGESECAVLVMIALDLCKNTHGLLLGAREVRNELGGSCWRFLGG